MSYTAKCPRCDRCFSLNPISYLCSECNLPLLISYEETRADASDLKQKYKENRDLTIWRYKNFLPLKTKPDLLTDIQRTPLIEVRNSCCNLYFKDETRNPTLSLKDRASYVVTGFAQENNYANIICASTGNAAISLARMCTGRKIQAHVIVPSSISNSKLSMLMALDAKVYCINGSYDDAYRLSIEISGTMGFLNRNTAYNPICREGKKTAAFEICEQLNWITPDWVIVPIGDGNIVSGLWKGFSEYFSSGLISKLPKILGVQASGSNAISQSLMEFSKKKFYAQISKVTPTTNSHSISVSFPSDGHLACSAILDSKGIIIELEDHKLRQGAVALSKQYGLICETSSASTYAALDIAIKAGTIKKQETVVCLLTGHGIKESEEFLTITGAKSHCKTFEPELSSLIKECEKFS